MKSQVWTARTLTPKTLAATIRSPRYASPAFVRRHFDVDGGGSFDLEAANIAVRAI